MNPHHLFLSLVIGCWVIIQIIYLIMWLENLSAKRYYARTIKELRNGR